MRARTRPDRTRIRSTTYRAAGTGLIRPRTISGQLARILAVSLVLVLALLGLTVSSQIGEYRRSGQAVDAVVLALAAQDLVQELQRERGLSNGLLGGDARLGQSVLDQRTGTDLALRNLSATVAADPPGASEVSSALGHLTGLPGVRSQIDTRNVTRSAAFQFYTDGIDAMNRLFLGLDQARDPQVRHGLQALYALGDAKEYNARERGFLNGVFAAGEFAPGEYVQFLDIRAARTAALTQFGRDATVAQRDRLELVLAGENAARAAESENIAIASTAGPLTQQVDPAQWWAQMTAVIDDQRAVQQTIGDDIRARADELRREAAVLLAAFALAALLAIAAEFALVFASIRAIVRPLARLAAEADDVASARLPEVIAAWRGCDTTPEPPAPVRTPPGAGVEIAAVAGALDRVQTTAFELASEQALVRRNTTESMANLARRNQNLVRRQLGLISEFEREELDPKALSNLFELDHLATRMRRNAESLLVLVGEASPRRWAEPIALSDVIRAGLSEVDDYRRVALRRVDEIAVTGAVVSELAHILAELIENGLAFSPPDLEVEVYGRRMAGGYLLAVVDHGVGMPADALAEANARLRGEQDFIVASTRYLGHYVVGRLASRLDISVELTTSPVSGIVARLLLPPAILADDTSSHPAGRPDTATRATPADSLVSTTASEPVARRALPRSETATGPVVAEPPTLNGATAHPADSVYAQFFSSATASVGAAGHADDRTSAEPGAAAGHSTRTTSEQISGRDLDDMTRGGDIDGHDASADNGPAIAHRQVGEPAVVERTRNGLVKRAKRATSPGSDRPHRDPGPHQDRPPALDRTPDQTRSMLASFRTGHERGGLGTELSSTPAEHIR
ncbi:nitrate- and nitrite sensing domain-containing protein [Nocardia mangyaensis]|uniref:sensor histidine kinase n=1 Tax=Nocardia mangyaensis TaxID=2213200 RepID=UPI000A5B8461|nr:nitrate- and nitrite sensing domain-containing protein [Nocardia mangyaensis]